MTTSPNGWPLLAKARTTTFSAGGRSWRTAPGLVASTFSAFLTRYALEVEPIVGEPATGGKLDDWGWADRVQRDSATAPSNHWSGTAVDVNALQHLRGVDDTFTPTELRALRALLEDFPVLRWGGDYTRVVDDMHIEINVSPRVLAVWVGRHLSAAATPRTARTPQATHQPSPQEDDDVVTRADMETIARLAADEVWRRQIAVQHPLNGDEQTIPMDTALGRAASVTRDMAAAGLAHTGEQLAEHVWDRHTVAAQHPLDSKKQQITMSMALGRAASVIPDGLARGVLHEPVDLEESAVTIAGEVTSSAWSPDAQASLLAGLEHDRAQRAHDSAVLQDVLRQLQELLSVTEQLYRLTTDPLPVLVEGSTEATTPVQLTLQTHARVVQLLGLVAGTRGALDTLAVAAAKGNVPIAETLQDAVNHAMVTALPRVKS